MAPVDPQPESSVPLSRPRRRRPLTRRLSALGGAVLLLFGLAVFVTPIPFGAVLVGGALLVLVRVSPTARLIRRALARRYPGIARRLDALRRRMAARLRR